MREICRAKFRKFANFMFMLLNFVCYSSYGLNDQHGQHCIAEPSTRVDFYRVGILDIRLGVRSSHISLSLKGGHSLEIKAIEAMPSDECSRDSDQKSSLGSESSSNCNEATPHGEQIDWDPDEFSEGEDIKDPSDSLPDTIEPTQMDQPQTEDGEWTDAPCYEEFNEEVPLEDAGVTVRFSSRIVHCSSPLRNYCKQDFSSIYPAPGEPSRDLMGDLSRPQARKSKIDLACRKITNERISQIANIAKNDIRNTAMDRAMPAQHPLSSSCQLFQPSEPPYRHAPRTHSSVRRAGPFPLTMTDSNRQPSPPVRAIDADEL